MTPRREPRREGNRKTRLSPPGTDYAVWAASAKVKRQFDALREELQLDSLVHRLATEPLKRVPGKTKKLRGRLEGVLQYDLPDGNRAHYHVSGADVFLIYVGRHPKAGG